ncbi:photosystem I reaction center subunit psaK, chloroplastic-like [Lotus japonicus]|uniref:photosystem I reaction center subunit psaK, chloroplastic-like n=1 Tax=Lotus japonicus TaxID=34305 RepID=UPI002583FF3D|nr:photosystem I reaction center subunit psaK, chloroplastic-like [Lotus japonicus]XP_057415144.1 photosystem I reaction center subunit psaK, chloroplastic-like [Lotus japonicus]
MGIASPSRGSRKTRSLQPLQHQTCKVALAKQDSFILMPTGGGRCLCYPLYTTMMTTLPQLSGLRPKFLAAPVQNLVDVQPMKRKGEMMLWELGVTLLAHPLIWWHLMILKAPPYFDRSIFVRLWWWLLHNPDVVCWKVWIGSLTNRKTTAGLKLEVRDPGLQAGDQAGFTLADTLACGTVCHINEHDRD